jgi:hypothetical protein
MFDITGILQGLIGTLVLAVLAWAALKWREISSQYPHEATLMEKFAEIGARAAEQVYVADSGAAKAKLAYALSFVRSQCERYHVTYSEQEVLAVVEAKVNEFFAKGKAQ